ncbi:DUF3017 domain-containing protein [Flindersiella endophytica]
MTQAPVRGPVPRPIRRSLLARQWPLGLVLAGLVCSLGIVVVENYLVGTLLFAGFVLLGAGFRLLLPTRRAGLLVLRSRALDVTVMTVMGVAIAVLAVIVPNNIR